jgi:hypothetical protein
MKSSFARLLTGLAFLSAFAFGQNYPQAQPFGQPVPPPPPQNNRQDPGIDLSNLQTMLGSAQSFHNAIDSMHLRERFRDSEEMAASQAVSRKDYDNKRTMAMIGAGAGIGVALAGMTRDSKTVMIGAIAGGVGGLIVDQIMRNRARKAEERAYRQNAPYAEPAPSVPAAPPVPAPQFKTR